jgi:NAD(P)H-hydrate epimerase
MINLKHLLILQRLVIQCQSLEIPIVTELTDSSLTNDNDLIVDALFGFSFTGEIRSPFDKVIRVNMLVVKLKKLK